MVFIVCNSAANGLRYRRLERKRLGNGELPKLKTTSKKRAESQPSGSIMRKDMADRCPVGPPETVVQQDRHVLYSWSPNSCLVVRDRILARAACSSLYVEQPDMTTSIEIDVPLALAKSPYASYCAPAHTFLALFQRKQNSQSLDIEDSCCTLC